MTTRNASVDRSPSPLKRIAAFIGVCLVFWMIVSVLVEVFTRESWRSILGYAILMTAIVTLSLASARYKFVGRAIERFLSTYFRITFWMIAITAPLAAVNWLSRIILVRLPLSAQIAVFLIWAALLTMALVLISTEKHRASLFQWLGLKVGSFAPVAYSVNLLMIAVVFFSSVTFVLANHGVISLSGFRGPKLLPDNLTDFYLWHFFQAIPLLKVNDTLHWPEPLSYSGFVGLMLLIFKLTVILPVIAAFSYYWKHFREGAEDTAPQPEANQAAWTLYWSPSTTPIVGAPERPGV